MRYINKKMNQNYFNILTASPPDAKDILGISCVEIIACVSRNFKVKHVLDMDKVTFDPAWSIIELSPINLKIFLSTYKKIIKKIILFSNILIY